jgi:hypothetical protein
VDDLAAIAALATAAGTLVLAVATFAAVRSANRAARVAERAFLAGLRPVLVPTRADDPEQKVSWGDNHWTRVKGGQAGVEATEDVLYLSLSLRNVGNGIAILRGWRLWPELLTVEDHVDLGPFRQQIRDLYVPATDVGFWQGALRDTSDPLFAGVSATIAQRRRFTVELLYSDHEGGQRTVSRFVIWPSETSDLWLCVGSQHWNLDSAGLG